MKYDFDKVIDRRGTCSLKWDYPDFFYAMNPRVRLDDDTIRLQIADMDFECAPAIRKALHRAADYPVFGYAHYDAKPEYRESIVRWHERRQSVKFAKESIVYCGSALEGVRQAIRNLTVPGDGVIVCKPVYSNFMSVIKQEHRQVINCSLVNDNGCYSMNWDCFEEACAEESNKLFVLCSPDNPVGRVWTRDELTRMVSICRKNHVVLVSDEIHSDIIGKGYKHIPIIAVAEDTDDVVMVAGPNKAFNLMGLQCAYAVIPNEKLRMKFTENFSVLAPSVFTIEATIAAYNESEEWLDALLDYLDDNIEYAVNYLHEHLPKVTVRKPEGTYILWADFSQYGFSAEELYERIGIKENVFLQGGKGCDSENGEYYLRICISCPRSVLEEALKRIVRGIENC